MTPVEFLVDRMHVSTPDADVEADIRGRAEGKPIAPDTLDAWVAEALARHHHNREEYRWVMGTH